MSSFVSAHNLSLYSNDGSELFSDFNFSIGKEKIGLVGKNGLGKTSLLRLLMKEIPYESGDLLIQGRLAYMPQNTNSFLAFTVAEILNIKDKLDSLEKAECGLATAKDFEIIDGSWDLKNDINQILEKVHLSFLGFDRMGSTLSCGEMMRLLFAKILFEKPELILLDEPTNNLDAKSKKLFLEIMNEFQNGVLLVSHDREFLNTMDKIFEISNLGLKIYGGNYNFYLEQRSIENDAAQKQMQSANEFLIRQKFISQQVKERQEHKSSRGKKSISKGGFSRIEIGKRKDTSEATIKKLTNTQEEILKNATNELEKLKEKMREEYKIFIDIEESKISNSKQMLILRDVNYKYEFNKDFLWSENINIEIIGNKRIEICGENGSGKTTLIKLITNKINPTCGEIKLGSKQIAVLDQRYSILDDDKSILENLQKFSSDKLKIHDLRIRAGRFLFYGDDVFKKIKILSGGECLRVALACLLATNNAPDIFILDEPTNNLDLDSIEILTRSLNEYKGTLLVISHDSYFMNDLKLDDKIVLKKN